MTDKHINDDSASDMSELPKDVEPSDAVKPEGEADSPSPSPDPSDLDSLWAPMPLAQTRTQVLAMRAEPRPPKDKFIRVLQFDMCEKEGVNGYENCRPVYLFEYQFEGDLSSKTFYVRPGTEVATLLAEKERLRDAILVLGVVRHGDFFVWELKLPNGRNDVGDRWAESRIDIAKRAKSEWLKPKAKMSAGGYDYESPMVQYEDPDWSLVQFDDAIKAVCKGEKVISTMDHEAVVEALGL